MTRPAFLAGCLLLVAAAAGAQRPRIPVPVWTGASTGYACSTARMMDWQRAETPARARATFAVRTAPSRWAATLARFGSGTPVFACLRRGNWFGIVFHAAGQRGDCGVRRVRRSAGPYRGPCRSGWVHYDDIAEYADWISP